MTDENEKPAEQAQVVIKKNHDPRDVRYIVSTLYQHLGKRYTHLELYLGNAPREVVEDMKRLVRDVEDKMRTERSEGRKDVTLRGRLH